MPLLIDEAEIKKSPKVLLHDHLDGGVRSETLIELAQECGYPNLPKDNPKDLAQWYWDACNDGSLELYLETFEHTISLMQTQEQIIRVAREAVIDLALDGVVYAEIRGAPELFTRKGLTLNQVIEATNEGFAQGMKEALGKGFKIQVNNILCALRQNKVSFEIAQKVLEFKDRGVVGFDIAGPEAGFPPDDHLKAFSYLEKNGCHFTIHAGEADGVASIAQAVRICHAQRIGHGIRLIDDIEFTGDEVSFGDLAQEILDRQILLEMAPTSNLQTGGAKSYETHQIGLMKKLGFNVSINTDNRLMSRTNMSNEILKIAEGYSWNLDELQDLALNAIGAAFIPKEKQSDIAAQIREGFKVLA